ncbi:MAG: Mth938-like domain-containing protein [Betaproteobacteria bacterium]
MKLHADPLTSLNTVTAYGPGFIEVNAQRISGAVLVSPDQPLADFPVDRFDDLTEEHFTGLLARQPEIVLLGTGARQRFAHPRLTRSLAQARVGVECMTTQAACRTYNLLMTEGRRVLAIFLPEPAQ